MKKAYRNYFLLSVMLILIALIVGNCGGGDDTGAVPDVSGNSAQTQNLVTKDIAGFVYATSSLSSSKDGEEEDETSFSILDIPLSGEEGFIAQVNEYIQEDTSSKGSSPETEELLTAFTEEANQYQPLPVWNSAANIYSSYADSLSSSPVSITSDGEISGSVLVDAADDLISLDIEVSGEECYMTETISSSDLLNSSDTSVEYVLKSCPGKIIIKPGDCKAFQVFSKPSVNLFDAGLQFSIANPEFGTVCGPIYLRCNGAKKYSVAYGVIYAKKNVETPLDTVINVTTTQGQNLSIPVQIVKKTAVVSGKVYASGPIVKGFVISQGPKSQCKINADGTYSLPKVWQGTGRKITATWWIMNGNQKVRYRETKFVDVFGNVTVNFGVVPTPTIRPPSDPYYDNIISKVISQKREWEKELGVAQGVQKTVDWLNDLVSDVPVPPEIAEVIVEAKVNEYDSKRMKLYFTNGMVWALEGYQGPLYSDATNTSLQNKDLHDKTLDSIKFNAINSAEADTVKNSSVVILWPYMWQKFYGLTDPDVETTVYALGGILKENGYDDVKCIGMRTFSDPLHPDPNADITFEIITDSVWGGMEDELRCKISKPDNIIRPQDFEDLDHYGVIYIGTHGYSDGIIACPAYFEDEKLNAWLDDYKNLGEDSVLPNWEYSSIEYLHILDPIGKGLWCKAIKLTANFFYQQDFSGSLVYINACESYKFHENAGFWDAKVYLGYSSPEEDGTVASPWCDYLAYYYFYYLMYEFIDPMKVYLYGFSYSPPEPLPSPVPMSVRNAYEILKEVKATPDQNDYPPELDIDRAEKAELRLDTGVYGVNDNTYFPVPVTVIVNKNNLK